MKFLANYNFKNFIIAFLILGIFGFYVATVATMQHTETMSMDAGSTMIMPAATNCAQPQDSSACLSFHLGIFHDLTQSTQQNLAILFLAVVLGVILGVALLNFFLPFLFSYKRLRISCRQLMEKTLAAFFIQLGFWLTLFEKRDPAYALALV